jgi:hypothetical protein
MPQAQVWNDNVYPHVEKFKGVTLEIPAGGCISMDYEEANQFLCQFFPMQKTGGGQQDPKSFKRLRVEPLGTVEPARVPLVCHATGQVVANEGELKKLNEEHAHLLHDDAKEELARLKEKDDEIAKLKAELVAAKTMPPKNKGGRPRKEA